MSCRANDFQLCVAPSILLLRSLLRQLRVNSRSSTLGQLKSTEGMTLALFMDSKFVESLFLVSKSGCQECFFTPTVSKTSRNNAEFMRFTHILHSTPGVPN